MSSGEALFVMTIVKDFTVQNVKGWHARPCAIIARTVARHPSLSVTFSCDQSDTIASGSSIFELMILAVDCGDTITASITGEDLEEINELINSLQKIISQPYLSADW